MGDRWRIRKVTSVNIVSIIKLETFSVLVSICLTYCLRFH